MKNILTIFLIVCGSIITGCSSVSVVPYDSPTDTPTEEMATLTPFMPENQTATPTFTPVPTETPTATITSTPTPEPSPTSTPTWITFAPGKVIAPILLYHHIADGQPDSRYYISLDAFEQQMEALHNWGYTTVTVSTIANVLIYGGDLPARPVVITFDDGNKDVYENAFPIMQKFGFVGTFYIVGQYLDTPSMVSAEQLQEMIGFGWEMGSHSMSHLDLTQWHDNINYEAGISKSTLEKALQIKVKSFAYPFGTIDPYVVTKVQDYGYQSAVGLGVSYEHTMSTLYYLIRMEVQSSYDLDKFARLLPWHDSPNP